MSIEFTRGKKNDTLSIFSVSNVFESFSITLSSNMLPIL